MNYCKKRFCILFAAVLACGLQLPLQGQLSLPYYNGFDQPEDSIGWKHYAISGTDDWELGVPDDYLFSEAHSLPNAWVTDLNDNYAQNSERVIESPYFDLTDTTIEYVLSFYHKRYSVSYGTYSYIEYSSDKGETWQLLDDPDALKKGWMTSLGFPYNYYTSFQHSAINIGFILGQDSIKFRFRYLTEDHSGEGWMIDDFAITEEFTNIYATQGDSIFVSKLCPEIEVCTNLGFFNQYGITVLNTTNYYFSRDSILDASDSYMGTKIKSILSENYLVKIFLDLPSGLNAGDYYIIFEHDALDTLQEDIETDNIGYAVVRVDSIASLPYSEDFEHIDEIWRRYLVVGGKYQVWELGKGYRHHLEDAHSGTRAWHTGKSNQYSDLCTSFCNKQYIEFPFIEIPAHSDSLILNLWFKNQIENNAYSIYYTYNCRYFWNLIFTFPLCRDDDWDYINLPLDSMLYGENIKFRIEYYSDGYGIEGIMFDDVYIGPVKADLSIEKLKTDRFTSILRSTDTLKYYLNNCGLKDIPSTVSAFYWSNDTILDTGDILLGTKEEQALADTSGAWSAFVYTKPENSPEEFYIFYVLDTANVVDEMREYNNTGYFSIYQEEAFTLPYYNDFEEEITGWSHKASIGKDDWEWTRPGGIALDTAFSGEKAWITNSDGPLSTMSRMHLYSPIYDFSKAIHPVLEFDMKSTCINYDGRMNMSYSVDGGASWIVLDTTSQSYNRWYYPMEYSNGLDVNDNTPNYSLLLFAEYEKAFATYGEYNGRDDKRQTRYNIDLGFLAGRPDVRFRYNIVSKYNNSYAVEGSMIDNFSISESAADLYLEYKKQLRVSTNAEKIKFFMHIKNQGNYISSPGVTMYYVSSDTLLDASDYYLGQAEIPGIRPDLYYYLNHVLDAPGDLSGYHYLIYVLDATDTSPESNEDNNTGYWPLETKGISDFPYFNDFSDTIQNDWHQYSYKPHGTELSPYRFRTTVLPTETQYQSKLLSPCWYTERVPLINYYLPCFYLETPLFDFSAYDSIFLSFDLRCIGTSTTGSEKDGGNLEFSTDGGNNWTLLTTSYGQATHWYNYDVLEKLNDEPGWSEKPLNCDVSILDSTSFDLSFLRGEDKVEFRFKHMGCNSYVASGILAHGMKIDNFMIEGFSADYEALDSMVLINGNISSPSLEISYSISNRGETNGRISKTKFYWSDDATLDAGDSLIFVINEPGISSGSTRNASVSIPYPLPLNKADNYLFYLVDGDEDLNESDEFNNLGSYKISFPSYPNYFANIAWDTLYFRASQAIITLPYTIVNNGWEDGSSSKTSFYWSDDLILDTRDQTVFTRNEAPILQGDTLHTFIMFCSPTPLRQPDYYLFYKTDVCDSIAELDEYDNTGSYVLLFESPNTVPGNLNFNNLDLYAYKGFLYIIAPEDLAENSFTLKLIDADGRILYNSIVNLNPSLNSFVLPGNLPNGSYLVSLQNSDGIITKLIVLQR